MNILIYRNQLLQEVTTGAYFCDICTPLVTFCKSRLLYIKMFVLMGSFQKKVHANLSVKFQGQSQRSPL